MLATEPAGAPGVIGPLSWIELALIIFFVVFVAIVVRVMLARRGTYDQASRIPLDENHVVTPRGDVHDPDSPVNP